MYARRNQPSESTRPFRLGAMNPRPPIALAVLAAGLAASACEDPSVLGAPQRPGVEPGQPLFDHAGMFTTSSGIYRIPYANGTSVGVTRDHHSHTPKNRIDMAAGTGQQIVAAAGGWIRYIRDHNGDTAGRGDGLAHDSATVQDDSLEHSCADNNPDDPGDPPNPVVGSCGQYNNYVWIEHPNGEWTKYSHLGTGTVTIDNSWEVDDWVNAGEVLGLEDDIGAATGSHLHFEAAKPDDPAAPTLPVSVKGGFIDTSQASNLVPQTCDGDGNVFLYAQGDMLTADACDHDPPTADAGGPYTVEEGAPLVLDGTGSSDPDGNPLTYRWEPDSNLDDPALAQPTFVAGNNMEVDIALFVYDQIEALVDSANATITVSNVDPTVTIDPSQVTVIDEHGTVTVVAEFTDPGFLDTHTATIDWGVPAGVEGTEVAPADIDILDAGSPDEPLRGRVTGAYRYGDNDDETGFTIDVTVTDSDNGTGAASFSLIVNNVDPIVDIDLNSTVLLDGVPTVVASAGEDVMFDGQVEDPGSDDLTLSWDWGDGLSDSRSSLVNPPATDPLPSPTVEPRTEPDPMMHAFAGACLYEVTFSATDDDGGDGIAAVDVIIAGTADQVRGAGYWTSEYRFTKQPDFSPGTLTCYLDIVDHASGVFSAQRPLTSFDDAVNILWTKGTSEADDLFDSQLLAVWLNFANGAYTLDQLVDSTGDNMPDTAFLDVLTAAETLRTDPTRTRAQLMAMKDVLERLTSQP